MLLAGQSPDGRLVEIIELRDHPWYVASQFHPEFKSRPDKPHPLFAGFITAAIEYAGVIATRIPVGSADRDAGDVHTDAPLTAQHISGPRRIEEGEAGR